MVSACRLPRLCFLFALLAICNSGYKVPLQGTNLAPPQAVQETSSKKAAPKEGHFAQTIHQDPSRNPEAGAPREHCATKDHAKPLREQMEVPVWMDKFHQGQLVCKVSPALHRCRSQALQVTLQKQANRTQEEHHMARSTSPLCSRKHRATRGNICPFGHSMDSHDPSGQAEHTEGSIAGREHRTKRGRTSPQSRSKNACQQTQGSIWGSNACRHCLSPREVDITTRSFSEAPSHHTCRQGTQGIPHSKGQSERPRQRLEEPGGPPQKTIQGADGSLSKAENSSHGDHGRKAPTMARSKINDRTDCQEQRSGRGRGNDDTRAAGESTRKCQSTMGGELSDRESHRSRERRGRRYGWSRTKRRPSQEAENKQREKIDRIFESTSTNATAPELKAATAVGKSQQDLDVTTKLGLQMFHNDLHACSKVTILLYALLGILLGKMMSSNQWWVTLACSGRHTRIQSQPTSKVKKVCKRRYNKTHLTRGRSHPPLCKILIVYLWCWHHVGATHLANVCTMDAIPSVEEHTDHFHWHQDDSNDITHVEKPSDVTTAALNLVYDNAWTTEKIITKAQRQGMHSLANSPWLTSLREGNAELQDLMRMTRLAAEQERNRIRQLTTDHTYTEGEQEIRGEVFALALQDRRQIIHIAMHGLGHQHIDTRYRLLHTTQMQDFTDILIQIREEWHDHINEDSDIRILYTSPQPSPDATFQLDMLHIIVDVTPDWPHTPVLFGAQYRYMTSHTGAVTFTTNRQQQGIDKAEAIFQAGAETACNEPDTVCQVIANAQLLEQQVVIPAPGAYYRVDVSKPPQERPEQDHNNSEEGMSKKKVKTATPQHTQDDHRDEDSDTHSLVAKRKHEVTLTPRRHQEAWVYRRGNYEPVKIEIPSDIRADIKEFVTERMQFSDHDTPAGQMQLHQVEPTPISAARAGSTAYIKEMIRERQANKVISMIEVLIIPSSGAIGTPAHTSWTQVRYIADRSTRDEWLQQIELAPFCQTRHSCLVLIKGVPWSRSDTSIKERTDGELAMVSVANYQEDIPFQFIWDRTQEGLTLHEAACSWHSRDDRQRTHSRTTSSESEPSQHEDDSTSLMTLKQSNIDYRTYSALVFRIGVDGPIFVQTSELQPNDIMRHIQHTLCSDTQPQQYRSSNFHEVQPKPNDLDNGHSMILIQEAQSQSQDDRCIILLDYVILQPDTGPLVTVGRAEWRETKYVQKQSHRRQWLQEIGMSPFCPEGQDRCLVTFGNKKWKAQDTSVWTHQDGDYAQIIAPQPSQRIPFHHFWQCTQQGQAMPDAWLRWQIEADRQIHQQANSADNETTSMLQIQPVKRSPSFARAAQHRLRPPGNGVKFRPEVTIYEDNEVYQAHDQSMESDFVAEFCSTREDPEEDKQVKKFKTTLRFTRIASDDKGTEHPTTHMPKESIKRTSSLPVDDYSQQDRSSNKDRQEHLEELFTLLQKDPKAKYPLSNNWMDIPKLHPNTRAALWLQPPSPPPQHMKAIHIFLDGSYNVLQGIETSAWAYTVVVETDVLNCKAFHTAGFASAPISTSKLSSFNIGETKHSSLQAESSALFWALLWISSWDAKSLPPCHIIGDNLSVIQAAAADWKTPQMKGEELQSAKAARFLMQRLETLGAHIELQHTHSHQGQPYNEAADAIAKATCTPFQGWDDRRTRLASQIARHPMLAFAWWSKQATNAALPPAWQFDEETLSYWPSKIGHQEMRDPPNPIWTNVAITCGTINVFSGLDKDQHFYHRREAIAKQLHEAKWHCIGIQESRSRQSMAKTNALFHMLVSPATDRGQYGTELWISKWHPISGHTIKAQELHIFRQTPTLLAVAVTSRALVADFIVAHSPQRHSPDADDWWRDLTKLLQHRQAKGRLCVVLGDLNARVGSEYSAHIGSHFAQTECPNGARMRACLDSTAMIAANTFQQTHRGPACTYMNHRIDYILIPATHKEVVQYTKIDTSIDLLHSKDDHQPLMAHLKWCVSKTESSEKKRTYNKAAAATPEARKAIIQIFDSFEEPPWHTSLDDHVRRLTDHITEGLRREFPLTRQRPRKDFVGPALWELITKRNHLRQEIARNKKQADIAAIRHYFQCWRHVHSNRCNVSFQHQYIALLREMMDETNKLIHKKAKQDKKQHLAQTLHELTGAANSHNTRELYHKLRHFRPQTPRKRIKTPKPAPFLEGDAGPVETHQEWCEAWQNHWGRIECATIKPYDAHIASIMDSTSTLTCSIRDIEQAIPDRMAVEKAIRSLKKNKAGGNDTITPDIYRAAGDAAARKLHTIAIKQVYRGQTPAQHRGGLAIPLYKNKGSHQSRESYRSIILEDCLAKIMSKIWREQIELSFGRIATAAQGGARRGMGPCAYLARMRTIQHNTKTQHQAFCLLTLDIESAFYRSVRQLLIADESGNITDKGLDLIFDRFQLHPGMIGEFTKQLEQGSIMDNAALNRAIQRVIDSSFSGSWCRIPTSEQCLQTQTGTKPGSPIADLLFCMIMSKYMQKTSQELQSTFGTDGTHLCTTWVDDIALPIQGEASTITKKASTAMSIMYQNAAALALKVSLKAGKSEALFCFSGKGSRQKRRDMQGDDIQLSFHTQSGSLAIDIVNETRYLGATIDDEGNLLPEIKAATGQGYSAIRPLRKYILQNKDIHFKQRKNITQALAIAKATYSCTSWPKLKKNEEGQWTSRMHSIYRTLLPSQAQGHPISDLQCRAELGWAHPADVLRDARLNLLTSMAQWADEEFMVPFFKQAEIGHPSAWTQQTTSDFHKIAAKRMPQAKTWTFHDIFTFLQDPSSRRTMAKMIKTHKKAEAHTQMQSWKIHQLHGDKQDWLTEPLRSGFNCYTCGKEFATRTALGVHSRMVHGTHSLGAKYAPASQCFVCLTEYHTRQRLAQHLEYGTTQCLQVMIDTIEPLLSCDIDELNQRDADARRQANASGRRTKEQKRIHVRNATDHIEQITGCWDDRPSSMSQEELDENKMLQQWSEEFLIDRFLEATEINQMKLLLDVTATWADQLQFPRNVLSLFHHLAVDMKIQFDEVSDLAEARRLVAHYRNRVLQKWQD